MTDKLQQEIDEANTRYTQAKGYWTPYYARCAEELAFLSEQWRSDLRNQRESEGRPVVQLPRIQNFIRQLLSQNRQSKPRLLVSASENSSKENADIVNGIIRKTEAVSNADSAYDYASEYAVKTGLGFIRVYTDYRHWSSFDQDVYIESIYDPSTVYFDPASRGHLFEDADYVFIETTMSREDYANRIGSSTKLTELAKLVGFNKATPMGVDSDHIIVLEYIRKVYKKSTVYKYANISTNEVRITTAPVDELNWVLVNQRTTSKCEIRHSLFDGIEFHSTTTFPGEILPVIPVIGEQQFINRVRQLKGVIKDSMDVQRIMNYAASVQLETVDLAPKVPWLVEEGAIEGYENEWREANSRNYSYLVYKARNGVQPPQRMPVDTNITGITSIKQQADADMQAIFGIFDASLGNASPDNSGVAIQTRVNQSSQSTYIYKDNLFKSIRQVGRIISDIIPTFYNGRTINIIQADGTDQTVTVNIPDTDVFEISIKEGPTNESARQSLNADLMQLVTAMPQAAPLLADYIIRNSDIPGTDRLVARLQTLLPVEVRQIESAGENMKPEELQALMMQQQQEAQQLNAHAAELEQTVAKLTQEIQALKSDNRLDAERQRQDYEIKSKQLQLDATKLELDFQLQSQNIRLQTAKLELEASGVKTDQIQPTNLE
jgi:hypothetical protein